LSEAHRASCACGQLRVEVDGPPRLSVLCSCSACKRRTGSMAAHLAYWREDRVRIEGEARAWSRRSEADREFASHFCPVCGTSVWFRGAFLPGLIGVAAGCFDDPEFAAPQFTVWNCNRAVWLDTLPDLPRRDTQEA